MTWLNFSFKNIQKKLQKKKTERNFERLILTKNQGSKMCYLVQKKSLLREHFWKNLSEPSAFFLKKSALKIRSW